VRHDPPPLACVCISGGLFGDIDDRMESGSGMTRDILRVNRTDAAGAKLAEADHIRQFGYCLKATL
jgi:hypothetical protein